MASVRQPHLLHNLRPTHISTQDRYQPLHIGSDIGGVMWGYMEGAGHRGAGESDRHPLRIGFSNKWVFVVMAILLVGTELLVSSRGISATAPTRKYGKPRRR